MINKVKIIAEAGVNHNGSMDLARQLIDAAADAGADYVKFQSFKADKLASASAKKAEYQSRNTASENDSSQFNMLKRLELTDQMHNELIDYCNKKKINFLSSAFDPDGLSYLNRLGLELIKVPSGELTNKPYLQRAATLKTPILLSSGMAKMGEIETALDILIQGGLERKNITVLHCNTEYPTPFEDVNLRAMQTIEYALNVRVGYSDHTPGLEVPVAAVAMGAKVIEKHFTLDRNMEGPDHKASLEPHELKQMVQSIRNIEKALGSGIKEPSASESKNITIARKSIFTARPIESGAVISEEDLIMKRPGDGISPMRIDEILGRKARFDLEEDHQLKWTELE